MVVKSGSYPGDNIVAANAVIASCPGNNGVTIQGESRAGVVIQHVYYGNQPDGQATAAPHNLTLTGVTLTWGMEINGAAVNDVIDNVDGGSIAVSGTGTSDITIQNSDWGPCDTYGNAFNGQPADCRSDNLSTPGEGKNKICCRASNIVIENNTFHDYIYHGGGPHFECWWIAGGTNITFDGNKFYNCQTNGVSLGDMGNDANTAGTWYFQNNWCSNSLNQGCFKFGQLPYAATMIFRFNSFAAGRTITNEEPTNIANPNEIYIVGNVLGTSDNMGGINCIQNAVYDYNVELQGGNNQGCGNHRTIIELAALHQPRQPPRRRLPPERNSWLLYR